MTDIFFVVDEHSDPTLYKAEGVKETEKQYDLRPAKVTKLIGNASFYMSIIAKGYGLGNEIHTDGASALEHFRIATEEALTRAEAEAARLKSNLTRVAEAKGEM